MDMMRANSVDPDQILLNVASDQGLHCLPYKPKFVCFFWRINRLPNEYVQILGALYLPYIHIQTDRPEQTV